MSKNTDNNILMLLLKKEIGEIIMKLYIGNKNYSSWSMRPWIVMKQANIDFEEIIIPIRKIDTNEKIRLISPSGKVPCLHDGDIVVYDSLAISEYINEIKPSINLWPEDKKQRALARSICAEMHSSFVNLRIECPMNAKRNKKKEVSELVEKDLDRIYEIWSNCLATSKSNGFLFGKFSITDAFFAPVVSRILSYQLDQKNCSSYINFISKQSFWQSWYQDALKEEWEIEAVDNI